jgi:hypothetical protein
MTDEPAKLVATWKLVSSENEFQDGTERRSMMGATPTGYIIFTPEGRMMSIVEAEGRKAPETDQEAAAAFRTMFAYTGIVQLDGNRWATKVDVAWNPAWHGTEQVRTFKLDGDRLEVTSAWGMSVNLGKVTRGVVVWERVK